MLEELQFDGRQVHLREIPERKHSNNKRSLPYAASVRHQHSGTCSTRQQPNRILFRQMFCNHNHIFNQ